MSLGFESLWFFRFSCGEVGYRNSVVATAKQDQYCRYHQMKKERHKKKSKLGVLFGVKAVLPEVLGVTLAAIRSDLVVDSS